MVELELDFKTVCKVQDLSTITTFQVLKVLLPGSVNNGVVSSLLHLDDQKFLV